MAVTVRSIRERAGLSQSELARRSGVAQPNIAAYESGRRRPSTAMLERLARAASPLPRDALVTRRDDLLRLAAKYGLSNVRIFGSAARSLDRPGSDIDLLVTCAEGVGLLALSAFVADATELLGLEVDVVTDGGLSPDHPISVSAVVL